MNIDKMDNTKFVFLRQEMGSDSISNSALHNSKGVLSKEATGISAGSSLCRRHAGAVIAWLETALRTLDEQHRSLYFRRDVTP